MINFFCDEDKLIGSLHYDKNKLKVGDIVVINGEEYEVSFLGETVYYPKDKKELVYTELTNCYVKLKNKN